MGVDPILAGTKRRNKIAAGREIVLVATHKKKENIAYGFYIIQISQSYCFYLTIYVFTEVCRIQKKKKKKKKERKKKVLQNLLVRSEMWQIKQIV